MARGRQTVVRIGAPLNIFFVRLARNLHGNASPRRRSVTFRHVIGDRCMAGERLAARVLGVIVMVRSGGGHESHRRSSNIKAALELLNAAGFSPAAALKSLTRRAGNGSMLVYHSP